MYKVEDNRLETYRQVCAAVTAELTGDEKTAVLKDFFENGADRNGFKGDLMLWVKLLLPGCGVASNTKLSKTLLLKHFASLFGCDFTHLERTACSSYDITEALRQCYAESLKFPPRHKSTLYLQDIEDFRRKFDEMSSEKEQLDLLKAFCQKLTPLDLKTFVRLILRAEASMSGMECNDCYNDINVRHVLDAIAIMAYPTYLSKHDLEAVVREYGSKTMQAVRERQLKGKRYIRFWEICSFFLTFVFVYSFLLFLRNLYVDGIE